MSTPIRDLQNLTIGYQDEDGTVRDRHNKKIGHITHEGAVYNHRGEQVGTISKAREQGGTTILQSDVLDRWGRNVGTIDETGKVQDWHGVPIYSGSAAPLLLDFNKKAEDPLPSRFDFDELARQAPELKPARTPLSFLPEGFVSPSMIGCLGIAAAIVLGFGIMYIFQNPSFLSRAAVTPTGAAVVANATRSGTAENSTAVPNAAPKVTTTPQQPSGKVNTQILNLREGPATSFEVVDRLQQDEVVVIQGRLNDSVWLKVSVPSIGKEGWVATEYIDANVDVGTLPVVSPPAQ